MAYYNGTFGMSGLISTVTEGIKGMEDLAMIALVIGGMIEVIKHNGGIQYVLDKILSRVKSRRGAEFGIAGLASVLDLSTANNTISIIMGGPLAKNISEEYGVDPRKSASILDIFSGSIQGMLPYGAQVLAAAGLASISPLALLTIFHLSILNRYCWNDCDFHQLPLSSKEREANRDGIGMFITRINS